MIAKLAMLALLTITDPSSAPAGADTLTAPTSALYRSLAPFALREVSILEEEQLALRIRLGSYANPLELENGFSHPVVEVYVGGGEDGHAELLPGLGMRLPDGETWNVAFRLTGDEALGFAAGPDGMREFEPELVLDGDYLYVYTDLPGIEDPAVAALTGLYSPFHADGWRPLSDSPGPWAFSGEGQLVPVVDVLGLEEDDQRAALQSGILPVTAFSTVTDPDTVWFVLMAAGVGLAGAGLIMRAFSASARPAAEAQAAAGTEDEAADDTEGAAATAPDSDSEVDAEEEAEADIEAAPETEAATEPDSETEFEVDALPLPAAEDEAEETDVPRLDPEEQELLPEPEPEDAASEDGFGDWLGGLGGFDDDDDVDDDTAVSVAENVTDVAADPGADEQPQAADVADGTAEAEADADDDDAADERSGT